MVLRLIALGITQPAIAHELGISLPTLRLRYPVVRRGRAP
jgi:DNA-binding NarL/FixJ family response regulator